MVLSIDFIVTLPLLVNWQCYSRFALLLYFERHRGQEAVAWKASDEHLAVERFLELLLCCGL